MDLPDNYFRDKSPADIIAKVATITLANISLMGETTLRRIGWLDNPIVDILYSLTSAGVWIARVDASGKQLISDTTQQTYQVMQLQTSQSNGNFVGTAPSSQTAITNGQHKIGYLDITLVGGSKADNELVPALAGYYGVMRVLALGSNTPDTYTWTFQDEDNTLLAGGISGVLMPEVALAHVPVNLYPGYVFTQAAKTDNKALEVDVTGGAGVEHVIIIYEYWYET